MRPNIDLEAGEKAWRERDAGAFAACAAALGIDFDLDRMIAFAATEPNDDGLVEAALGAIYRALTEQHGIGLTCTRRSWSWCVAVRVGDQLHLMTSRRYDGDDHPRWVGGYPWYQDPARNRRSAEKSIAWGRGGDPRRIAIPIVGRMAGAGDGDAGDDRLLRAVLAAADDVATRLVYADSLLERGDVQGELIRLACELEAMPLRDPRRTELRERVNRLERDVGAVIGADVAAFAEWSWMRRGMVDGFAARLPPVLKRGAAVVAKHPIRTIVVLVDDERMFERACTAKLPEVRKLGIATHAPKRNSNRIRYLRLDALAKASWPWARELLLRGIAAEPDWWARAIAGVHVPRLASLEIDQCMLDPSIFSALARTTLTELETLTIRFVRRLSPVLVTGFPAERARELEVLPPIEEPAPHVAELARSPVAERLRVVCLQHWESDGRTDGLGNAAVRELLGPSSRMRLENLAIGSRSVDDASVEHLLASAQAPGIRGLDVENTRIGGEALVALLRAGRLERLEELRVGHEVSERGHAERFAEALLELPSSSPLRRVYWEPRRLDPEVRARVAERFELVKLYEGETILLE